jgi:hypothetical protein
MRSYLRLKKPPKALIRPPKPLKTSCLTLSQDDPYKKLPLDRLKRPTKVFKGPPEPLKT